MNCPNPYCVMRDENTECCNNFKEEPDYPTYCETLELYKHLIEKYPQSPNIK